MGKHSMDLYLDNIIRKYKTANRRQKGEILEELRIISGYHKKLIGFVLVNKFDHKTICTSTFEAYLEEQIMCLPLCDF